MKTIIGLCFMVLLGLAVANRGPCGCLKTFEYCANDNETYHSICEYKCIHPTVQFQDWFILYNGPCIRESGESNRPYTGKYREIPETTTTNLQPETTTVPSDDDDDNHDAVCCEPHSEL
ncbi:uncharacterized protein LOC134802755 [Cydia splendana]|uniref:uncharacterized protein LOC134802755 n=1 Tax=Cydia splendana TaxID=1100963 RepID=UPI0028F46153